MNTLAETALKSNDSRIRYACYTASRRFGSGIFSYHASYEDAEYNAEITGGQVVRMIRDGAGDLIIAPPSLFRLDRNLREVA